MRSYKRPAASRSRPRNPSRDPDSPFTPSATPQPTRLNVTTRGLRASTIESFFLGNDAPSRSGSIGLPAHYTLAPTVPSPYTGTLEASLDAVLEFGVAYAGCERVVNTLLEEVKGGTNWPALLREVYLSKGRMVVEEILFLVTRTLMPEQIAESRTLMATLYESKKHLAIRVVLRYDMLRERSMDAWGVPIVVASLPPPAVTAPAPTMASERNADSNMGMKMDIDIAQLNIGQRRPLRSNIIPTLIAAPEGGWTTHAVRERMKHHVTDLDKHLLLSDGDVAEWSDQTLLGMASQIVLQWQWLRQNNEMLSEMEVMRYDELEGKADECDWIMDDIKKRGRTREKGKAKEKDDAAEFEDV